MKRLEYLSDHDRIAESFYFGSPEQVSIFRRKVLDAKFLPETSKVGELAQIDADNYYNRNFERAFMYFDDRCPTWPEMVELKSFFWHSDEIVFQVHPKKENYVNANPTALHLWRPKDAKSLIALESTRGLIQRAIFMFQRENSSSELFFKQGLFEGKSFVAIFGGKTWPTWEEVCSIKKHCFGEDKTALQFNISKQLDLNRKHILILWNADDFEIELPPKDYV